MKHYRQVPIEELPEKYGFYSTDEGYEQFKDGSWFLDEDKKPTWWLKPIEAHVLTDDELKEIKNQAFFEGYQTREQQLIEEDASRNFGGI